VIVPRAASPKLRIVPLTPSRWADFERLFGPRGACGGCWCMAMRLPRGDYLAGKSGANKRRMTALVRKGPPPGVLGYLGKDCAAWCAIGPRADFDALARSRIFKPLDDEAVWSITCLFLRKNARGLGLMTEMARGAAAWARKRGARIVEAYPTAQPKSQPDVFLWTGVASGFARAGFREVARRSKNRPMMRLEV
jgi:GNAT superfamily N-acetyltransferase